MGDVFEVVAEYFMDQKRWYATFYCYYDEKRRALLAFTSSSAEEIDRTLDDWVHHQPNVYYLWINPRLITDIEARIINDHPDTIIPAFTAMRFPWSKFSKVIRPDFERSFQYHGDDGRFTLEELENYYGVLPTSIDFAVPRAAHFRMTDYGLFTFKSGNLDFVFDVINQALSGALKEREIIQEARYEFIPLTSGRKQLQVLNVVPQ